jgi:hypothetical protein
VQIDKLLSDSASGILHMLSNHQNILPCRAAFYGDGERLQQLLEGMTDEQREGYDSQGNTVRFCPARCCQCHSRRPVELSAR